MNIQENLATNLIKYRKSFGLTQADIAEKLNYSDKTVSKWERGESIPDLLVLKQLADFYHVKIDTLLDSPKIKAKHNINISKKRALISCALVSIVWIFALLSYLFIDVIFPLEHTWLAFINASCGTSILLLILAIIWKKNSLLAIFISAFIWTLLLSVYMALKAYLISPPKKLWEIFLIGIPLQAVTVFFVLYRIVKNFDFKKK